MKKLILIIFLFSCSQNNIIEPLPDNEIFITIQNKELSFDILSVIQKKEPYFYSLTIQFESGEVKILSVTPITSGYYGTSSTFFSFTYDERLWSKVENSGIFTIESLNDGSVKGSMELDVKSSSDVEHIKGKFRWQQ